MEIKETFVSVDVESSGPIPPDYSMLSLGACLVFDTSINFYRELKPLNRNYVQEAIDITGLSLEKLREMGVEPKVGMRDLENFLKVNVPEGYRPIFVGHNAPYDWSWVNYYFHKFLDRNPFGHNALDVKAYYMGKFKLGTWAETSLSKLKSKFLSQREHTHNALDDAIEQAEIFRKILEYEPKDL